MVFENTGAVYLSIFYNVVEKLVSQQTKGDQHFVIIDVCKATWIGIWPNSCAMFTPSINMHDSILLALDLEAQQPVQRGERQRM